MADQHWLTILGVGDNGLDSLSGEALKHFEKAEVIIAPSRVLDVINTGDRETIPWTFGVKETIAFIEGRRGQPTTILATGDPMHFGIGATLRRYFSANEMLVVPSPSGFSLAGAKMGWALQDVAMISLHGRAVACLHPYILPGKRIISLTSNARTLREAAKALSDRGYGRSQMTLLEHIGGVSEKMTTLSADELLVGDHSFMDFNMLAIEVSESPETRILPTIAGLPDDAFVHDGQLTKREVRAATLAFLQPVPGQTLWDVGAGCGSVSIEWMRAAPGAKACAIEQSSERCAMILENANKLGVPKIEIIEGEAPDGLEELANPHAVFIGGGLTSKGMFDACWSRLPAGGRLVANAVTVESEAMLLDLYKKYGGELTRIQVSRAEPVGRFSGWKPSMPVTIWSIVKGASHGR